MLFYNFSYFLLFYIVLLIKVTNFLAICILTQYFYDIFSFDFSLSHILIFLTNWFTKFLSTLNKFSIELHQVTLSVCPLSSGPLLTTLYSHSSPYSPGHLICAAGNTAHCTGNIPLLSYSCCLQNLVPSLHITSNGWHTNTLGEHANLCVWCSWAQERRLLSISTNDFKVWHVSEYGKVLMSEASRNHLYTGDTYVVRWYYHVTATGRTLKVSTLHHQVQHWQCYYQDLPWIVFGCSV